ncbi:hypothetical protein OF385_15185 [Glutamicibacter sp. JL.03c]|uniref:hypothetical protein n=1 Tax=Glutamicibacter sp. JL.03c TaxID=2984842 RepID=UPI0021F7AA04|nr:hypothetical protein [Glutamicibacter sp. JL.03c]UYQ77340.1 hypothetical protein OF385_15185 [Glutamicibacter sp. JL.03c]
MRNQHKQLLRLIRNELQSVRLPVPMNDVPDDEYEKLESKILSVSMKLGRNEASIEISKFMEDEFNTFIDEKQMNGFTRIIEKVQERLNLES